MLVDSGRPQRQCWPAPRRTHPRRMRFDFVALLPAWVPTHYHRRTATISVSQAWWRATSTEAQWVMLTEAIAQHLCAGGMLSDPHAVASRLRQIPDLGMRLARVGLLRSQDGVWFDALASASPSELSMIRN
jgi:hypothetical protein